MSEKLLLSITGNEYQKNLFRTGIKASPGIEQRKKEKKLPSGRGNYYNAWDQCGQPNVNLRQVPA